ncbi:hypothetical protein K1719_031925 [Acacia pycnantha]|nr:hypothetical protein K1719_031925 [Acacia pycnantha]
MAIGDPDGFSVRLSPWKLPLKYKSPPRILVAKSASDHRSYCAIEEFSSLISKKRERVEDWEQELLETKKQNSESKSPWLAALKSKLGRSGCLQNPTFYDLSSSLKSFESLLHLSIFDTPY